MQNRSPAHSDSLEDDTESDFVEHDVRVCDICGDAGSEDLLATCSKCNDGAEHTYCMRERMDKIPDADWLCEECELLETIENERLNKDEMADLVEKDTFFQHESMVHDHSSKIENRHNFSEIQRLENTDVDAKEVVNLVSNFTRKRCLNNIDGVPVTKKPSLFTAAESQEAYCLEKTTAVSEEASLKAIDKNQIKQPSLVSCGPQFSTSILNPLKSSDIPQFQLPKGILSKSYSFGVTVQSKANLADESLCKKSKDIGERDSTEMKDNYVKSMGRSVSFKSASQSKGKVLFFDGFTENTMKSWKLKNKRKPEEKNRFHSNSSSAGTSEASPARPLVNENTLPACGETSKPGFKNSNTASEVDIELPSLSSYKIGTWAENVPNQIDDKDHIYSGDEPPLKSTGEGITGVGVSQPPSIKSHMETASIDSLPFSKRPGRTAGQSIPSQINKSCSADPFPFPIGRGSRGNTLEDSKLKAAIEAAFLKKPGIYNRMKRSNNLSGRIPESEVKSDTEAASLDRSESQPCLNNTVSSDGAHGGPACTTIPQRDYIWQGSFEVHKNCKILDHFDGVQAHLSATASSKVVDIMCNLSSKIALKEVSQLSVWPKQFHHIGVKDDNIALYFFARDSECYEGHYKRLLDNLMMNNLALKGSFDGVELLIFPSSHLPEKSHCWNMLYFLWGVFRLSVRDVEFSFLQKNTTRGWNGKVESRTPVMEYLPPNEGCTIPVQVSHKADLFPGWEATENTKKGDSEGGVELSRGDEDDTEENNETRLLPVDTPNSTEATPNLDLALGAERKTPKNLMHSSFDGITEKQEGRPSHSINGGRNGDSSSSSSLSLSLSLSDSLCRMKP